MTRHCSSLLVLWLAVGGAGLWVRAEDAAVARSLFAWQREPGHVGLLQGDRVVWRFNYSPDLAMPCFHPVALPGGPTLTGFAPPDHPWHYGLWFAWKYINGVNYWEINQQTGRQDGVTRWSNVRVWTNADFSARIELDLTYHPGTNHPPVVAEKRVVAVSAPAGDGSYRLDWSQTFAALAENVRFDRTPLPGEPEGKAWGGYSGLSVRFASNLVNRAVGATDGPVIFEGGPFRGRGMAMDYSGSLEGQWAGVALVDSPSNPDSPSPWYVVRDDVMSFISPAILCYEPIILTAGDRMRLSYRVIVHPGPWGPEQLHQAVEAFQHQADRENR